MSRWILFVDDEPLALRGFARAFRAVPGWETASACGGVAALELLRRRSFDVLVTDLRMPGIDGVELLKFAKTTCPRMVRIVISGDYDLRNSLAVSRLAHRVLTKPCSASEIERAIDDAVGGVERVPSATLRDLIGHIGTLPSLPRLYDELVALAGSEQASLARLGRIIAEDPAMAAKVLHLVNSSFFGLPREIHSIEQAAGFLGIETLKALALSAHAFAAFDCRAVPGFSIEGFQRHSVATMRLVAAILAGEEESPAGSGAGITAALLHDIGRLIIASRLPAEWAEIDRLREGGQPVLDAEVQVLGVTHAEIGAGLLTLWGLPKPVVDAVRFHHAPSEYLAEGGARGTVNLAEVLHAADYLVDEPREGGNSPPSEVLSCPAIGSRLDEWRRVLRDIGGESAAA